MIKEFFQKVNLNWFVKFYKKHSREILALGSLFGVCWTGYEAVEASRRLEKAFCELKDKNPDYTIKDAVYAAIPCCIRLVGAAGFTFTCILVNYSDSRKKELDLKDALSLSTLALKGYKDAVIEMDGEEKDKQIEVKRALDQMGDIPENARGIITFKDSYGRREFKDTIENVLMSEYELNRLFILRGYASLNDFYRLLDIGQTDFGDGVGWGEVAGEVTWGYRWIDFNHVIKEENGQTVCIISYPFEPHKNYLEAE